MSSLAALCSTPGCRGNALSGIASCWEHHPEQDAFKASILRKASEEGDLAHLWLCGVDLSGLELVGANLAEAHLDRAVLRGARLSRSLLYAARLVDADAGQADFTEADLGRVRAHRAYLA